MLNVQYTPVVLRLLAELRVLPFVSFIDADRIIIQPHEKLPFAGIDQHTE